MFTLPFVPGFATTRLPIAKPVGTVCFAWARRGGATDAVTRHFEGDRTEVRRQSVIFALQGLIERLDERLEEN